MAMDLLIIVSNPNALPIVTSLATACGRANTSWAIFFTNDGVTALQNEQLVAALSSATDAICCQESWQFHLGQHDCPIELGSQTGNSALVGAADRVLSL